MLMKRNQTAKGGPIPKLAGLSIRWGFAVTLALMAFGQPVFAQQTGEIEGQIVEEEGEVKAPIPFANVIVEVGGTVIGTVADIDGRFALKPLKPGFYDVQFTAVGKDTVKLPGVRVSPDKITRLGKVEMRIQTLEGAVVYGYRRPLIDAEDPTRMELLWEDIERSPNLRSPADLIANFSSDIKKGEDGQLYFRGARPTDVVYFVDGVKSRDGSLGMPSSAIGGMQVYTGGVPARYGDMTGGAVIVETKSYFDLLNAYKRRQAAKKQ